MAKVSAAAVAAAGVGGTGAAALGAYGLGYFGDGSGANFTNPKHKELIAQGRQYTPAQVPVNDEVVPTNNPNK